MESNTGYYRLLAEQACYLEWLRKGRSKEREHKCFDVPAKKKITHSFDFEHKLMQSAMHGCTECLNKLIKAGAYVNKTEKYNFTALMWASREGHPDCVKLLLKAGVDLNITDEMGHNALSHAVNRSKECGERGDKHKECVAILIKALGNEVIYRPEKYDTPLMSVAAFGRYRWLHSLIEAGASVNRGNKFGDTALMNAAAGGHIACLVALLDAGADADKIDIHGDTALMKAIDKEHDDCALTLINAGADVNVMNRREWTALMHAMATVNNDCITWLLDAGALVEDDINATYIYILVKNGGRFIYCTPEKLANLYRCIQQLLKIGGYINQRSETALKLYIERVGGIKGPIQMLLLAAGETLNKTKAKKMPYKDIKRLNLKDYMNSQDKLSLKHLSREAVRKQMIRAHRHHNLFCAVPKLGIPSMLESYLVYDVSLDAECCKKGDVKFLEEPVEGTDSEGASSEDENSDDDYYSYEEDDDEDDDDYYYYDNDAPDEVVVDDELCEEEDDDEEELVDEEEDEDMDESVAANMAAQVSNNTGDGVDKLVMKKDMEVETKVRMWQLKPSVGSVPKKMLLLS